MSPLSRLRLRPSPHPTPSQSPTAPKNGARPSDRANHLPSLGNSFRPSSPLGASGPHPSVERSLPTLELQPVYQTSTSPSRTSRRNRYGPQRPDARRRVERRTRRVPRPQVGRVEGRAVSAWTSRDRPDRSRRDGGLAETADTSGPGQRCASLLTLTRSLGLILDLRAGRESNKSALLEAPSSDRLLRPLTAVTPPKTNRSLRSTTRPPLRPCCGTCGRSSVREGSARTGTRWCRS